MLRRLPGTPIGERPELKTTLRAMRNIERRCFFAYSYYRRKFINQAKKRRLTFLPDSD